MNHPRTFRSLICSSRHAPPLKTGINASKGSASPQTGEPKVSGSATREIRWLSYSEIGWLTIGEIRWLSFGEIRQYADRWLHEVCAVHHSYSYLVRCRQVVTLHLCAAFGEKKLQDVTSQDILCLQRALYGESYAVQSISNILATASSIFKDALAAELVTANPCSGVKRLKKGQRPELEVWTLEERDRFLRHLYEEHFPYFQVCAVALFTGLRPAELRGLLRDAVDFEACQIRVHRQWCSEQNMLVPYTKTRAARTVPIPRQILDQLSDMRSLASDAQLFPFLTNSFGHTELRQLMVKAGVQPIRMHDFRHTFASQMLKAGASLVEVKELLGHRKLESTAIYLHYIPDRNQGATDKLLGKMGWRAGGDNVVALAR
jgi:integrase